ncbi:DUF2950 domain-containing protein [Benzoatithermus flavus]|uniref:DUF2950 domain-containing protein n=1 Tax=Benzoatithermus flavus TaxID=3108223 RepID=A0ABU8XT73_9PROT
MAGSIRRGMMRRQRAGAILVAILLCGATSLRAAEATFATPQAALAAFAAALNAPDGEGLVTLFGPEHRDELLGGDPAAARQGLALLRAAAAQDLHLEAQGQDRATIVLGRQAWPMPIPLVRSGQGWRFDTEAGLEEIVDRRIGRNELAAIRLARAYADAQLAYASADRDGDDVLEYAQKLASTPGQHDGLYWQPDDGGASPLAAFAAQAAEYLGYRREGEPYRGYWFRILTGQGPNPPGGAYDYVINGNMIAGFALVAWPADYRNSGVMTFVLGHRGRLYQKDLGPDTTRIAEAMTRYDPDASWTAVAEEGAP